MRYDREVMEHLLDMTPPGIDEVMALLEIMGRLERHEFDTLVVDTAPTGHLIRFLETPDMVRSWLAGAVKLLLKYRGMFGLESAAELVLNHARQARKLRALLLDADRTDFLVVTIPEAMAMAETERLLHALGRFQIACQQIIVNMVTAPSDCSLCAARQGDEQRHIQHMLAGWSQYRVALAPRLPHPVQGSGACWNSASCSIPRKRKSCHTA